MKRDYGFTIFAILIVGLGVGASCTIFSEAASLLYEVTATDPAAFGGMVTVLGGVALLAGYLPALRASRIEPVTLLRSE